MEKGIDDASWGMARQAAFPACTARLQTLLREEAASRGWELSVDLFTSEVNAVTPLFFSVRGAGSGGSGCPHRLGLG